MNGEQITLLVHETISLLDISGVSQIKTIDKVQKKLDNLTDLALDPVTREGINILHFTIKKIQIFLSRDSQIDDDMMEELNFFLKGALTNLIDGKGDKIGFLKDWVENFLDIPSDILAGEKEVSEKFVIFSIGQNNFGLSINFFQRFFLIENNYNNDLVNFEGQKIPIINREVIFGEAISNFPKTILILKNKKDLLALEIDKIMDSKIFYFKDFYPIEKIAGNDYLGPIKYLTVFDDNPLFIIEPNSSFKWPLTNN